MTAAQPDSSLHCTATVTCDSLHCTSDSAEIDGACAANTQRSPTTDTNAGASDSLRLAGTTRPTDGVSTASAATVTVTVAAAQLLHSSSYGADFGGACAADTLRAPATVNHTGACATSYGAGTATLIRARTCAVAAPDGNDAAPQGAKKARTAGLFQPSAAYCASASAYASGSSNAADTARPPGASTNDQLPPPPPPTTPVPVTPVSSSSSTAPRCETTERHGDA